MKIFIASHGEMAAGIENTLGILVGNTEKLTVYNAYVDETTIHDAVQSFLKDVADETVLFTSDIYGGSVNQNLMQYLNGDNRYLVAGANLAFVLEAMLKDDLDKETINQLIENSRSAMQQVVVNDEEIEDDF